MFDAALPARCNGLRGLGAATTKIAGPAHSGNIRCPCRKAAWHRCI